MVNPKFMDFFTIGDLSYFMVSGIVQAQLVQFILLSWVKTKKVYKKYCRPYLPKNFWNKVDNLNDESD